MTARYGYRTSTDEAGATILVTDESEQRTLARIHELDRQGMSCRQIALQLEAEGHQHRGARWYKTTIHRLLHRSHLPE